MNIEFHVDVIGWRYVELSYIEKKLLTKEERCEYRLVKELSIANKGCITN